MPLTDGLPYKSIAATISDELHASAQPKLPPPPSPSLVSSLSSGADWANSQSIQRQRDQAGADLMAIRRYATQRIAERIAPAMRFAAPVLELRRQGQLAHAALQQQEFEKQYGITETGPGSFYHGVAPSTYSGPQGGWTGVLGRVTQAANEPFAAAGEAGARFAGHPELVGAVNPVAGLLAERYPNQAETVGRVAGANVLPLAANVATGGALTPALVGTQVLNGANDVAQYRAGNMSDAQFATSLGENAAFAILAVAGPHIAEQARLRGFNTAEDYLLTPEGQAYGRRFLDIDPQTGKPSVTVAQRVANAWGGLEREAAATGKSPLRVMVDRLQADETGALTPGKEPVPGRPESLPEKIARVREEIIKLGGTPPAGPFTGATPADLQRVQDELNAMPQRAAAAEGIRQQFEGGRAGAPQPPAEFPRPRSVQEAEGTPRYVPQEQAGLPPIEPNIQGARIGSYLKAPDPTYNAGSYFWRPDTHEFVGAEGQLAHQLVENATQQTAKGLIDNYGWVRMTTARGEYGLDGRTAEAVQNAARDILDTGGDPQAITRYDVGEANVNKPSGEVPLEDVASGRAFGGEKRSTPFRQFARGLRAGERGGIGKPPPEPPQGGFQFAAPGGEGGGEGGGGGGEKKKPPVFGENVPQGPAAEPPPLELTAPPSKEGALPLFDNAPPPAEPYKEPIKPNETPDRAALEAFRGMPPEERARMIEGLRKMAGKPPPEPPQYPMQATPENLQRFLEMDHPGAGEPGYQEALDQARRFAESNGITTRSGRPGTETDKGLGQLLGELAKVGEPAPTGPVERTPATVTAEINDLTRQRDATMNNDRSAQLDRQIDDLKLERAALEREQRQAAEPQSRNAEVDLSKFDTPQRFARVTLDKIRTLPNEFQARNVEAGKTFTEARVNDIVKNYDPELMTPLIVAPDPQNPGGFVLLAGHHRLEALRRMGLPADIQIADVNISTPEGLAKARTIADASNLTQHGTTIGERIRAIDRAGTDDVATIRSMFPALNDQQIRDAIYVRELPTHVVDRLDKLPENSPVTGIAAEVGYGKKAYGFSPDEAEGLFNRLTKTGKGGGKMITRTAAREAVDKFGALFAQRKQAGLFGEGDVFGASNRVLDAMDQYARLTRDIETGIRTLTKELKTVAKYGVGEENPKVAAAKAKLTDLETKRSQLEDDLLGALKNEEPAGNVSANLSATSTAEARGIERTSAGVTPETGTQPPSEIPSTTSPTPSGLTTRNMPPTGALEGGTTSENIAPSVPPFDEGLAAESARSVGMAPLSPSEAAGAPSPPEAATVSPTSPPQRPPPRPPTSGLPPVPPEEPPPPAVPPGAPLGPTPPAPAPPQPPGEGNQFFGDMRPFGDQAAEVVSADEGNAVTRAVRTVLSRTPINPGLRAGAVEKALIAYERQRIAGHQLANVGVQAINDVYATRGLGGNLTFKINADGNITNVRPKVPGASLKWQDVFSRPGDYNLNARQAKMAADFIRGFQEIEKVRVDAGLPARAKNRPEGEFYVPHQVKTAHGVEIRRPSDPSLQRVYDLAEEGAAQGIRYDTDPRNTLLLHALAAYREIADKQLSDALEPLSLTPSDLVPAGTRAKAEKAGRDLAAAQEAILALQRARRGEQLQPNTIKRIERLFPQLENRVQDATEITLDDLYKMSDRAKATGERVYKPVTPKLLRDLKKEIGDLEDYVVDHPNDRKAAIRLRELRQQQGFARYRFGIEQDFREQSGMGLGDMLENEETWTRIPRSTRTIVRENPRTGTTDYGDAVQTTQGEMLKQMISDIRGTPYTDVTTGGNAVTKYRGGYMEAMRKEVIAARQQYTHALEQARKTEVINTSREISRKVPGNIKERMATIRAEGVPKTTTPAELWGVNQGENIPVAQWRNRFFRREDADMLRANLGAQGLGGPWDYLGRGAELLGGYIRFGATGGDIAAPLTHGLPTFGYNPVIWGRAAASHFFAMFDPTVQARMIRDHMQTVQEMARYGLSAGDTEFFQVLQEGAGVPFLKPLERVPGGHRMRETARLAGKQTYGRSSVSYSNFLGLDRILLWESMKHLPPPQRAQIIRNMTGGLDSAALGVGRRARQFESLWIGFAPKLFRSTAAYMAEARNPFNPTGRIAARSMAGLAVGIIGLYVAAGIAMGRSEDEIKHGLNPLSGKKFLAYKINGDWIGVGGMMRALIQLTARVATDPKSLLTPDMQDNPLAAFYTGRGAVGYTEAQLAQEATDSPPDMAKHLGTAALPFVAQSFIEGQGPAGLIGQELGFRTSHETPFEALTAARDAAAQRAGYKDYQDAVDKIGPGAASRLTAGDQAVSQAQGNMPDNPLRHESELTVPQQKALDDQLESGQLTPSAWREQRKFLQANEAGRIALAKRQMGLGDKPTGDPTLDGFYDTFDKFADPQTGFVADPQGLADALDQYTGSLSPDQLTWLNNNTGYSQRDTPKVQEYHNDVRTIAQSGYFNAQDAATRSATEGAFQTYGDFIKALTAQAHAQGVRPEDSRVYKTIQTYTARAKDNWLRDHPQIDALVDYWYNRKPRSREAQDELFKQKGIHVEVGR